MPSYQIFEVINHAQMSVGNAGNIPNRKKKESQEERMERIKRHAAKMASWCPLEVTTVEGFLALGTKHGTPLYRGSVFFNKGCRDTQSAASAFRVQLLNVSSDLTKELEKGKLVAILMLLY
jgi:hypothetical protein